MERRQDKLMKNAAFLGAVYLDPRYNTLLAEEDCVIAKAHLAATMKRIRIVSGRGDEMEEVTMRMETDESEDDDMERLLKSSEKMKASQGSTTDVKSLLDNFVRRPRIPKDCDLHDWWAGSGDPELLPLAQVACALPVTQVSVERTFSGLSYILDDRRMSLKDDTIDAIMLLRCNV